jgi:hypothetical protein
MPGNLLAARRLPVILAVLFASCSVFYSGVIKQGGAKDIDARYFFVAAKCWAAGISPYEPGTFRTVYESHFAQAPDAPFVAYLPTLMAVILPMAPFDWPLAAKIFSLLNFLAAMVLFWACYRLVREAIGRPLQGKHWLWVIVAATLGGISGTVFTGQTSVFISAACAIALLGCRLHRSWMTVIGLAIASAKPHLSGPLLLFIALQERNQRLPVMVATAVCAMIFGYAAVVDSNLLSSYLSSIAVYNQLSVNDPAAQIGLAPLLLILGISPPVAALLGAACLAVTMGIAAWSLWTSKQRISSKPRVIMLLVFSVGLAHSIQGYDLCIYAVGIALLATVETFVAFVLFVPAAVLWRPELLNHFHLAISSNLGASVAAIVLSTASLILVLREEIILRTPALSG